MPIKVLMVDVDGVIVVHPHPQGWSVNLERDLGLSRNTLQTAFFEPHFDDVVHGRAALRERLGPVLRKVAPHLTCDQLIDYWFRGDSNLNLDLLQQLGRARRLRRFQKLSLANAADVPDLAREVFMRLMRVQNYEENCFLVIPLRERVNSCRNLGATTPKHQRTDSVGTFCGLA
jgi:hypothetical protein